MLRKVVTNVNASLGVNTARSETFQPPLEVGGGEPAVGGLRTTQENRSVPVSMEISWAPRIVTSVNTSLERVRSDRSDNLTFTDRRQTGANVSFAFRVPPNLIPLRSDVRTALRYQNTASTVCIQRAGTADCLPVSDSRRREYNLNMDTDMPPNVSAGLSVAYVLTDDRHANRKFSQLVVTANVTVSFSQGDIR